MTEPEVKYMNVSLKRHHPEHRDKLFFGEAEAKSKIKWKSQSIT